jgi:hypothetical protein
MVKGERVARGALLPVRSDDRDLSQRFGGLYETSQAVCEYAVVVCAEQSHR